MISGHPCCRSYGLECLQPLWMTLGRGAQQAGKTCSGLLVAAAPWQFDTPASWAELPLDGFCTRNCAAKCFSEGFSKHCLSACLPVLLSSVLPALPSEKVQDRRKAYQTSITLPAVKQHECPNPKWKIPTLPSYAPVGAHTLFEAFIIFAPGTPSPHTALAPLQLTHRRNPHT